MNRRPQTPSFWSKKFRIAKRYWPIFLLVNIIAFNEYFIYYSTLIAQCSWPCDPDKGCSEDALKSFMIADTHLLGKERGHWFDKMRREWQMFMSYRAATAIFDPDVVFFLGDLLDEGQWADEKTFAEYADRFHSLFPSKNKRPERIACAGNHDLGFHYAMNQYRNLWFLKHFNNSAIEMITVKGNRFVLMNSMAFEGDNCRFCASVEQRVFQYGKILESEGKRPIVIQHFPLFRTSDDECEPDEEERRRFDEEKYRERWEVVSREATKTIIQQLRPRAVFDGHSHKNCRKIWRHPEEFTEYTVNSFSWRNNNRPALLLTVIENDQVRVSKCYLPKESTQVTLYIHAISIIIFAVAWRHLKLYVYRFLYNLGILNRRREE